MACVGGLGQFEFRFAAEFIEVSLASEESPCADPKHGGISQNARQSREPCALLFVIVKDAFIVAHSGHRICSNVRHQNSHN